MKVVINDCYGGYGVSAFGMQKYAERKGMELYFYQQDWENNCFNRVDPDKTKDNFCPITLTKDVGKTVKGEDMYQRYSDIIFRDDDIERTDPDLVFLVETYGDKMDDYCSKLKIVEIPDNVVYDITDYDGHEWIAEKHRTWD